MLPHLQREKNKRLRKKRARKLERESRQELEELRAAHWAMVPQECLPKEPERLSQTELKRREREAKETKEREAKKASHKLSWMDRAFGTGKGPIRLRMKWLDRLFENQ
jgi:hypothetical protein